VTYEPTPAGVYRISWKQIYKFHNVGKYLPMKWPATPLNEDLGDKALTITDMPLLPL
ncbi:hypothetical protein LCGC14_1353630, partial [marine sediment metagenome]